VLARENGRFLFAHMLVVPGGQGVSRALATRVRQRALALSWRLIYVGIEVVDAADLEEVQLALRRES
jgi:hypothetical protein